MATSMASSIALCPINFKLFDRINTLLNNVEATLLYSKIKFHQTHSKIKKENRICIARSREQMALWFGFGLKKVDRLLGLLESNGLIQKTTGTWYGKKRLFITASEAVDQSPINIRVLEAITHQTKSIKESLVFSRIAFRYANTRIQQEGHLWCTINKQDLATWASCSIRTIDCILQNLVKAGMLLKKNFTYRGKSQGHFHIPAYVIAKLQFTINKEESKPNTEIADISGNAVDNINISLITHNQNCRPQPAKMTLPIRIRSKEKQTNNNTSQAVPSKRAGQCDITFSNIGHTLTSRQLKYLESALIRTIDRRKIRVSNPKELWEQLKFALLNAEQRSNILSFQHAVSRFMKIIGDGNWKTPIGFYKHSEVGQQIKSAQEDRIQAWQLQKQQECQEASNVFQYLTQNNKPDFYQEPSDTVTQQAIQLAKQIRYVAKNAIKQPNSETAHYVESMTKQLQGFLRQGANQSQVLACLRG